LKVFRSQEGFREWLEKNHGRARALLVGFYKADSGKGGISYQQALDEALCFGWIDGVRKRVDDSRYTIRFTPRRAKSNWSQVNLRRVGELSKLGRMRPPGLAVFEERTRSRRYSYESRPRQLSKPFARQLKANRVAWTWFSAQASWYRRTAAFWVMSAKQPATQARRLAQLIDCSARGVKAQPFQVSKLR
jgi:uncharacterized protein YdeI (YjbR/CyaY-like superfamily)